MRLALKIDVDTFVGTQLGVAYMPLWDKVIPRDVLSLVPEKVIRARKVLPVARLRVAVIVAAEQIPHAELPEEREMRGATRERDVEVLVRLVGRLDEPRVMLEDDEVPGVLRPCLDQFLLLALHARAHQQQAHREADHQAQGGRRHQEHQWVVVQEE